jgi:hypothetical protein
MADYHSDTCAMSFEDPQDQVYTKYQSIAKELKIFSDPISLPQVSRKPI